MDHSGKQCKGKLGAYSIGKCIAEGGMGSVYEAKNQNAKDVVIKFPATHNPDGTLMDPSFYGLIVEKLKIESQILKNFTVSNIPQIVKYIDETSDDPNGSFFLVIEKIEGATLDKTIPTRGLPESDVITFSLDILKGLEFMHKHNTIYRDLKPANIMVTKSRRCILIDFGGAKQGVTQISPSNQNQDNATKLETPGWTCPDQGMGKVSAECDLYAFGRVLFYMSTGIKPMRMSTATGRMQKKIHQIKSSINIGLSELVDELIDPDHNTIHTTSDVIAKLGALHGSSKLSVQPQRVVSSQRLNTSPQIQRQVQARIVMQGKEYLISNSSGGSLIGSMHDERLCQKNNEGCNNYHQGRNIFVGWDCPLGCRCSYNPAHMIDKHHMRIWRDRQNHICVVNNDSDRRSAINRQGRWLPMRHHEKEILRNHDQVALLYNEKKGPFLSFTFYMR